MVGTIIIISIFLIEKLKFGDINMPRLYYAPGKRQSQDFNPGGWKQEPGHHLASPTFGGNRVLPCPITIMSHDGDCLSSFF